MLLNLVDNINLVELIGVICAFTLTCISTYFGKGMLPTDRGKEFAHDGQAAKGKPQGAGLFFVLVFIISGFLFGKVTVESSVYMVLIGLCMVTGYLDDAASKPWGRLIKGFLDLILAIGVAGTYIYYNGSNILFRICGCSIDVGNIIMAILIVCVVWGSINVTNCADGVDGLSGTLSIITLISIYQLYLMDGTQDKYGYFVILFVVCLLAYLWFNATPSILMMGDAGSRAMGMMIAISIIRTGSIFTYAVLAIVLILDGGLGLIKVALIKTIKVHIMKNIRTPLHDQVRKNMGWSNTQNVFRFAIIQIVVNVIYLYLIKIGF